MNVKVASAVKRLLSQWHGFLMSLCTEKITEINLNSVLWRMWFQMNEHLSHMQSSVTVISPKLYVNCSRRFSGSISKDYSYKYSKINIILGWEASENAFAFLAFVKTSSLQKRSTCWVRLCVVIITYHQTIFFLSIIILLIFSLTFKSLSNYLMVIVN